jgi:D-alanine transfer protein
MNRQTPHLIPAIIAIALFLGFLVGFNFYAKSMEDRYVRALAPWHVPQANVGTALQCAAFQKSDLLVIYGSSEMRIPDTDYRADVFFKTYPTGFAVMDIAEGGVTSLIFAQSLAAIGPDLNEKKVVISFTPAMFLEPEASTDYYAGNFSHLHADELVFSPRLSMGLKRSLAKRMLNYSTTLDRRPLLKYELDNLGNNLLFYRLMYYAAWPLGELEIAALKLQDHAAVLDSLQSYSEIKVNPVRQPATIDWAKEINNARHEQINHSMNNSFGVEEDRWAKYKEILSRPREPGSRDDYFINSLRSSAEWTDFSLMLRVLKELGAKPLIMGRPLNGPLLNALGISTLAQNLYYDKLETAVAVYQFPLVDFRQQTSNPYFSIDRDSHTSREGWVYVDQALDAFYHGLLR